jgi:hypothetical protein
VQQQDDAVRECTVARFEGAQIFDLDLRVGIRGALL